MVGPMLSSVGYLRDKIVMLCVSGFSEKLIDTIKSGGVGVLPTDTLYGLVGSVSSKKAVQKIYKLRKRNPRKPMIILINSMDDLRMLHIELDEATRALLSKLWPGKVSVILPCPYEELSYLHRETKTLAFRLPKKRDLRELLVETGPLVAPTANLEGLEPAKTVEEAEKYFGDAVDFYVDQGKLVSLPSTLVAIEEEGLVIRRQGVVKISLGI